MLAQTLTLAGIVVEVFPDAWSALAGLNTDTAGIVLSDMRMPGMDALQLFAHLRGVDPGLPLILLNGHGDMAMAGTALQLLATAQDDPQEGMHPGLCFRLARARLSVPSLSAWRGDIPALFLHFLQAAADWLSRQVPPPTDPVPCANCRSAPKAAGPVTA